MSDVELTGTCTGVVRFVEAQEHVGLIPITSLNHLALVVVDRWRGTGAMNAAYSGSDVFATLKEYWTPSSISAHVMEAAETAFKDALNAGC